MPTYTDQLGRITTLPYAPRRIISVVPSQTELLFDLGLDKSVVGITKFCVHPESWFKTKQRVGGTKKLRLEKIAELQPDLIIANKEENEQADIEWLAKRFEVWISDIVTLNDAYEMILDIGELTDTTIKAQQIVKQVKADFAELAKANNLRTAYFIWRKPYMTVGHDTFINTMMELIGLENVFGSEQRYPAVSIEKLKNANPKLILLSSEPYPFKKQHIAELQSVCPNAQICLVDGEIFSWYGSRMLYAAQYYKTLVNSLI